MSDYTLQLKLWRDTIFGRGDGVAGLIDLEVEHDDYGLPFLRGRALKGILVYECADILFSLKQFGLENQLNIADWYAAARFLFGEPNSDLTGKAQLHIGNAYLPQDLRTVVARQMNFLKNREKQGQFKVDVLNSLTTVRRQTAVDVNGAAKDKSLRTVRLIQRETCLAATLQFMQPIADHLKAKALLGACVKSLRRGGTSRQRGPGLLEAKLYDGSTNITAEWFDLFKSEILPAKQEATS